MSKQVYVPVCVEADGTFHVDFDGAPWGYMDELHDVWDPITEDWVSSSIEGPNGDLVDRAITLVNERGASQ